MSSETDSLSPQCFNPECGKQFESVNEMVAVPGRGDRSPRHFCEDCAERLQRGPPVTDGGLPAWATLHGDGTGDPTIRCDYCGETASELPVNHDSECVYDNDLVADGGLILYLIRAQCPNCEEVTGFVEERVNPLALDADVHLSAEFCPNCSFFVAGEAEWDIHEETRIERVTPAEEVRTDGGTQRPTHPADKASDEVLDELADEDRSPEYMAGAGEAAARMANRWREFGSGPRKWAHGDGDAVMCQSCGITWAADSLYMTGDVLRCPTCDEVMRP